MGGSELVRLTGKVLSGRKTEGGTRKKQDTNKRQKLNIKLVNLSLNINYTQKQQTFFFYQIGFIESCKLKRHIKRKG